MKKSHTLVHLFNELELKFWMFTLKLLDFQRSTFLVKIIILSVWTLREVKIVWFSDWTFREIVDENEPQQQQVLAPTYASVRLFGIDSMLSMFLLLMFTLSEFTGEW